MQRNGLSKLNAFAIPAMEAAYRHGDEWLDSLVLYLENNMKIAMDYIDEYLPSMRYMKPDASYLLWLDIRDYELTQAELKRNLLKKGKVILELGNVYGHEGRLYSNESRLSCQNSERRSEAPSSSIHSIIRIKPFLSKEHPNGCSF